MSPEVIGILGIVIMLATMFLLQIPVGFAMALIGFFGVGYITSPQAALGMLGTELWTTLSSYGLTIIPLFIFMGLICFHSDVNTKLYHTAYQWLGATRGGLAMATVMACAGFAAISGSNTATAATMTSVALPEMKRYNYHPVLISGSIAAGSTLGVVIPPSIVLVVFGIYTGQSIAKLFFGSIIPGIILAILMIMSIYVLCQKHQEWGPAGPKTTLREKLVSLKGSLEIVILFTLVMGGLFVGFFTPSEAGAVGSFFALLISIIRGTLTRKGFVQAVEDTLRISCFIVIIIAGAVIFGRFLAITRLPYAIAEWAISLPVPSFVILWLMIIVFIVGGAIMDALGLLLITIPIFYPLALKLNYDPIWFGVMLTIVTTMGAITPPVGVNAYIVAGMSEDLSLATVFKGVSYFLPTYIICILLLEMFPPLVLFLAGGVR
ncbi:MAG: TRAP transporter large permease [Deltaproteobacteria bacterium]|nr:TRAP transporter large permease [Candidatus Anaeroferrophillus wilburensis]MBN2887824.1 TRAP transporter large permease [Deltaproteobacteria bacterium]